LQNSGKSELFQTVSIEKNYIPLTHFCYLQMA